MRTLRLSVLIFVVQYVSYHNFKKMQSIDLILHSTQGRADYTLFIQCVKDEHAGLKNINSKWRGSVCFWDGRYECLDYGQKETGFRLIHI
jgi:hypothetical protein